MTTVLTKFFQKKAWLKELPRPYIIAEAGVNHEGRLDLAKRMIDEAKEGGALAIKFKTYYAESLAIKNSPAYWDIDREPTQSQYELFKRYDSFQKKEFETLKMYCDQVDIEFLSTPFDLDSARFLNSLMPLFKIASADITNRPFIEAICDYKKPIILSTGASELWEVEEAISWIHAKGNPVGLMHCVLNYPTRLKDVNLGMMLQLKYKFPDCVIGYSDHSEPGDLKHLEIAALLGAEIIEKHFTLDKTMPGNDHYHAMDKEDLKQLNKILNRDWEIIGQCIKEPLRSESIAQKNARRSLVAAKPIRKGEIIRKECVTWKRPGFGISPRHFHEVIGQKAAHDIVVDSVIHWQDIKI